MVMNKIKQKQLGAFYTPHHTVDYMIGCFNNLNKDSELLEPSGGDGIFVLPFLKNKVLKPEQITVWDINPDVAETIKKNGIKNVVIKDSLLETNFDKNSLFGNSKIFSHIIGNPPYLNKQSFYIKKNKKKLGKIFKEIGANDTYAMFIYLGCNLLKENGELCFIVSDTFLTLGIHKKLRKFLLSNFTINKVTLCPKKLFRDAGALVNTAIIHIINKKPSTGHEVIFNDCRDNEIGDYKGKIFKTKQDIIFSFPDHVFNFNGGIKLLRSIDKFDKMIKYLDGGLGMHTTNNKKFLAIVDYNGKSFANNGIKNVISHSDVDEKKWKFYHKKGGDNKYYLPAEFAIKWDSESRQYYNMPKNYDTESKKRGFIISGISSSLSARMATPGALWESNKAMCFFSKEEKKYPVEFFIGLINSKTYEEIAKLLNHTNSVQIRDIKKIPLPKFKKNDVEKITALAKKIIKVKKINLDYDFSIEQQKINKIVSFYFD